MSRLSAKIIADTTNFTRVFDLDPVITKPFGIDNVLIFYKNY